MQYRFENKGQVYQIALERTGSGYRVIVDGVEHDLEMLDQQHGHITIRFDGHPMTIYWANDGQNHWLSLDGCAYQLARPKPRQVRSSVEGMGETVHTPMPAQVRMVNVNEGDWVEKGATLLLLEAMKMEIRIRAPMDGRISRIMVKVGQTVEKEQLLMEMGGTRDDR